MYLCEINNGGDGVCEPLNACIFLSVPKYMACIYNQFEIIREEYQPKLAIDVFVWDS